MGSKKPSRFLETGGAVEGSLNLVGGLEHVLFFRVYIYILGIIIPTGELMFFRGVETTNQLLFFFHLFPCLSTAPRVEVPMVST